MNQLEPAQVDSQQARNYYYLGALSQDRRDYPAALDHYRQALALDAAGHLYKQMLGDYATILNIYFYTGDYPDAMRAANEKLALAEEHHDSLQIARAFSTIGYIYFQQGNLEKSRTYYVRYLDLSTRAKDSLLMADAYSNIGEVGAAANQYKEAMSSLFKAYDLYRQLKDTERLAYTSYEISRVYKDRGNDEEAVVFALNTLKDIETDKYNEYDRAKYYINAGDIYKSLSDFPRAILMTRHGLAIAQHIHHREDVLDAWQTLAGIYALQHRYDSAYYYHTLYSALKDSISNDHIQQEIEEIDARYAVDKKDKEIALKSAQLARQSLLKNVFLYSFAFLMAFTLLLYSRRRIKQRADEEKRLNRQRNDLFGAIIMAQENERKRIAQDIHDTLGSLLSAAKLNLSSLDEVHFLDNPEQARKYRASLLLLDQVSTELRNIAHNIMPAGLSKIGLPEAVKGLLDTLSAPSGLKINYNAYGFEERLKEQVEISIYRVLLELINNVIKHSRATLLTIQMIRYPNYINIVVEDNGIGFHPEDMAAQGKGMGMGLGNILSRIQYLKGTMDIDSKVGAGTTILIEVPC